MHLLITGAAGYIGRHVTHQALEAGHTVRASLRDTGRAAELRSALGAPGKALDIVALDLTRDAGWDAAMEGVDGLLHTASPVPTAAPPTDEAVIAPALQGTERVLAAAARAGISRVVVTSSIAAILGAPGKGPNDLYDEADWTDPDKPGLRVYARSKTLAERAARRIAQDTPGMALATINPGFVFGAPLGGGVTSSLTLISMLLGGKILALPRLSFPSVSVGDVAEAHLRALAAPDGARIVASGETLWLKDIARIVAAAVPEARVPQRAAPDWAVRLAARLHPPLRMVTAGLGERQRTDPATCEALLGRPLSDPRVAIAETARAVAARP